MTSGARLLGVLRRAWAQWVAMLLAAAWYFYLGYGPTLDPRRISWMFRDDWAAYLWGFAFFRNAPWSFPLGAVPNLFYPHGTSVGFTDANPWASLLLRSISGILPVDFQFAGLWFLLCYVLQAWFGARIVAAFSQDRVLVALGGALFALTPILPARAPHVALCALFFVTAGIALNVRPIADAAQARRLAWLSIALLVWVAGTHAYLSVMLLALCAALYVRLWLIERRFSFASAALFTALALGATLTTYFAFGFIGWKPADLTAEGFGEFSGDLTALLNPLGSSRYVRALSSRPRQWEGFAYLGLGVLLLLGLGVSVAVSAPRRAYRALGRHWPLLAVVCVMLIYSWSSLVTYRGDPVLDLRAYYRPIAKLTGIFRSSGRFGWPLHVLLVAAGVAGVAQLRQRWLARLVLSLALLLQASELVPSRLELNFSPVALAALKSPAWHHVEHEYAHLELVPLHLLWICDYRYSLVNRLSYEAYRHKLTFNSGNFMRKQPDAQRLCGLHPATLNPRTIYVVEPRYLDDFRSKKAVCGALDGLIVCVQARRPTHLRDALLAKPML